MKGIALGLGLICLIVLPDRGEATVVKAHSLFEKTDIAKLIVKGRVESVRSEWFVENASAHTLVTLRVSETIKGQVPKSKRIIVRQAGGKIGDFEHRVDGISRWESNEEVILFLEPLKTVKNRSFFVELGIGIGKYEILKRGKTAWVHHNPRVALAHVSDDNKMTIEPAAPEKPIELKAFLTKVRDYVRGKKIPSKTSPSKRIDPPIKGIKQGVKQK
jgi:hypothetical protein